MRTFCITLPESPDRTKKARDHFASKGMYDIEFFDGIHAENFGIKTLFTYERDNPGTNFSIGFKCTGIWLSHWALWSCLQFLWDDVFVVFENDVLIPDDWKERTERALADVPPDFDVLYTGSCCTQGQPKTHVKGDVYETKSMLCTHAMILRRKAIPVLLQNSRKIYAPIDIHMMLHCFPLLKTFCVLPRIYNQHDTEIPI